MSTSSSEVQPVEQAQATAARREDMGRWKRFWLRNRDNIDGYLFVLPQLLFYTAFLVVPIFFGAWISLHKWDTMGINKTFNGLANFQRALMADSQFWNSLKHTLSFMTMSIPTMILLGLLLALVLNRPYASMNVYRTLFYMPAVLSVTVIGLVWGRVFAGQTGLLAHAFRSVGLVPINWLNDPPYAMPAVVIASLWWGAGGPMLIFLAGLQDIPKELYEAAELDGAGAWALFRYITIPGLQRPFLFILVTQVLGAFQVFGQVFVMTGGGPAGYTRTLVQYIYEMSFSFFQLGYGSAMAYLLFLFMFGVSLLQLRVFTSAVE